MKNNYFLGQENAFSVFQKAVANCIAYKKFIKENEIQPNQIKQLKQVPISDKNNYFRKYPLEEKIYENKKLAEHYMICTSSGSTGEPTIWLRDFNNDESLGDLHTDFLDMHFDLKTKNTLIVISFGLGSTTAGMLHAKLSWGAARDYKVSVVTPNLDADLTVYLINKLYRNYDQVICIGYPPFIEEFIELGKKKKMFVHKWNLKIVYTSESTSPKWRKRLAKIIQSTNGIRDIISFYACTEAGIIGIETPTTVSVIEQCLKYKDLRQKLFQSDEIPSLVEVNFNRKFVEIINNEVVVTVDQPIPIIRYNLHDKGMLLSAKHIRESLQHFSESELISLQKNALFLAIFGRNEEKVFSVEDLRTALESTLDDKFFIKEFQYSELVGDQDFTLTFKIYLKKDKKFLTNQKNKLQKLLSEYLSKQLERRGKLKVLKVDLLIEKEVDKIGYKSGKLRYFLT